MSHYCGRVVKCLQAIVVTLLGSALLAGCGGSNPARNVAKGKVTVDGEPAYGATLTLHYEDAKPPYPINVDDKGEFSVQGVPLGKVTVAVTSKRGLDPKGKEAIGDVTAITDKVAAMKAKWFAGGLPIPPKYHDHKTSGLTWEITGGTNQKNFELKKE
jgi:hypothetical protein